MRTWSVAVLVVVALTFGPGGAAAAIQWPAAGGPVCVAPGDQTGTMHAFDGGTSEMFFGYVRHGVGADTLMSSMVAPQPAFSRCGYGEVIPHPVEICVAHLGTFENPDRPGEWSGPEVLAWIEGSGATQRLVLRNERWSSGPLVEVDAGAAGPSGRSGVRLVGGCSVPSDLDTAVVCLWADDRTGPSQVWAQRVRWNGQREWSEPGVRVAPTAHLQRHPDAVRLVDGSTLIVWEDERNGGTDLYAQRLLPDGTPAPGWPSDGRAVEARTESSSRPRFPQSNRSWASWPVIVWEERGGRFGAGCSLVGRAFDGVGEFDPSWAASGVVLTPTNTVEQLQALHCDYEGAGLVAVWTDTRAAGPTNENDLYAQRLDALGHRASGWPAGGAAICTAPGREESADVDQYPSGATTYAWTDHRSGVGQVYVAMLRADATQPPGGFWVPNGVAVSRARGEQSQPVVEAGNRGGLFVAWVDSRNAATTGLDIYANVYEEPGGLVDAPPGQDPLAKLLPPWPNPSRGSVRFALELAAAAPVRLDVLDVAGRRVRSIAREARPAGEHTWLWDGRDDGGGSVPPGLYFVIGAAGTQRFTQRVIRLH